MIKSRNYLILFTVIACLFSQCNRNEKNKVKDYVPNIGNASVNCDTLNKIKLLLENVFEKRYLYPVIGSDTNYNDPNRYNYFMSKGLTIPNDIFYIKIRPTIAYTKADSIKIIPVNEDSIKNKEISKIYVILNEANVDTTDVRLTVGYVVHEKVPLTEASFRYSFDTSYCKWIMKDSSFWNY